MKKLLLFVGILSLCSADMFGMHSRRGMAKEKNGQRMLGCGRDNRAKQPLSTLDRRLRRGGVIQLNKIHLDQLNKEDLVSLVLQLGHTNESLEQKQAELTKNLATAEQNNTELLGNWKTARKANKFIASENARLKSTVESYATDNDRLRSTMESYATDNDRLRSTVESYATDNDRLRSTVESYAADNDRLRNTAESYAVALVNQSNDTGLRWLKDENQRQGCIDGILQVVNNRELTESCQRFRGDSKNQLMLLAESVKNSFDFLHRENEVRKREIEIRKMEYDASQSEIASLKARLSLLEKQLQEKNDSHVKAIEGGVLVAGESSLVLHNGMGTQIASGQEINPKEMRDKIFDKDIAAGAPGVIPNNNERASANDQRDSVGMQDMMSDKDESMSEQFAESSGSMAVESRSVDLGERCSYSGDFEGDTIHGMGTFINHRHAFDISGSFVHGCLDLTKPIKFEGYDRRIRQFHPNVLSDKELKIEVEAFMPVKNTSCADRSLYLILPQKQSNREGIIFREKFVYKGELDRNNRPEGNGMMIRDTGEIRSGNLTRKAWLQD